MGTYAELVDSEVEFTSIREMEKGKNKEEDHGEGVRFIRTLLFIGINLKLYSLMQYIVWQTSILSL